MKTQLLVTALAALAVCSVTVATRCADAAPVFFGTSLITNPPDISKSQTHQSKIDHTPVGATFVTETLTATNMVVKIDGGTPNGMMNVQYSLSLNATLNGNTTQVVQDTSTNNAPQLITLDAAGSFKHPAFNTENGDMSATVSFPANTSGGPSYAYTIDAIVDIYNVGDTTQKYHGDSSGAIAVSDPGQ